MLDRIRIGRAKEIYRAGSIVRASLPLKEIVLTAIRFKGIAQVRIEAQRIADDCFAKKQSVLSWVRKVERGDIVINQPPQ